MYVAHPRRARRAIYCVHASQNIIILKYSRAFNQHPVDKAESRHNAVDFRVPSPITHALVSRSCLSQLIFFLFLTFTIVCVFKLRLFTQEIQEKRKDRGVSKFFSFYFFFARELLKKVVDLICDQTGGWEK